MRKYWYVQETESKRFISVSGRGFIDSWSRNSESAYDYSERFAKFTAKDLTVATHKGNGKVYEAVCIERYDETEMG